MKEKKNVINTLYDANRDGLFGYTLYQSIYDGRSYNDLGQKVLSLFYKNQDNAELLNDFLVSLCGLTLEELSDRMSDYEEEYSDLICKDEENELDFDELNMDE